ncbi:MAG: hypothetical protein NXI31_13605 [bacterium]|nr:hypothetical protein [bacterium]
MSKSPAIIATLGLGGCVALSLVMRTALEAQQEQQRHPLEHAFEREFDRRLAAPVEVSERRVGGRRRLVVELCIHAGLRKDRVLRSAGRSAWSHFSGTSAADGAPAEIEIVVTDDGIGDTVAEVFPPPRPAGPVPGGR